MLSRKSLGDPRERVQGVAGDLDLELGQSKRRTGFCGSWWSLRPVGKMTSGRGAPDRD